MTREEEAAVERAARAIVRADGGNELGARGAGTAPGDLLDDVADDLRDWCALARRALDRAAELRGGDPEPEGRPVAQRSPSTLEGHPGPAPRR